MEDKKINCVSTKGAFRLIQSIPSKKAEPFKLWLAQVGYGRIQEIENSELIQQLMKKIYVAKGYIIFGKHGYITKQITKEGS